MDKIEIGGPAWAYGCEKCSYGIVEKPSGMSSLPLYIARATQDHLGLLVFCDCKAGPLYQQYLRKKYIELSEYSDMKRLEDIVLAEMKDMPTVHGKVMKK